MTLRRLAPVFLLCLFPQLVCARIELHQTRSPKIAHWLGSNKRFLVAGTALAAAAFADGYTTHRCLVANRCLETNPIFGSHPSARRLWLEGGGFVAGEETALYFLNRWTRDSASRFDRNTVFLGAAIPAGVHAWAAWHNAQINLNAASGTPTEPSPASPRLEFFRSGADQSQPQQKDLLAFSGLLYYLSLAVHGGLQCGAK